MATVTEELVYEYWDCDKCGQKAIRGDIRNCPACGSARNENIKFYLIEGKEEKVEDKAQAEKFEAGADWLCSFCETLNSVTDKNCLSCGASQESSNKNYFEVQKEKELKASSKKEQTKIIEPQIKKPFNWKKFSIWGLAVLGGCITSLFLLTRTHNVNFQVTDVAWERTIPVMRYTTTQQSDWEGELKGDDIVRLRSSQEIRSYENRQVGTKTESYTENERYQTGSKRECTTSYKSTGSGASKKTTSCDNVPTYSSRSVRKTREVPVYQKFPVYGTKVYYTSNMYTPLREDVLKGNDNHPQWPDIKLGVGVKGKQDTKGEPRALYIVTLKKINQEDKAKDLSKIKTTEDRFKNFYIVSQSIIREVNVFDEIVLEEGEERVNDKKE